MFSYILDALKAGWDYICEALKGLVWPLILALFAQIGAKIPDDWNAPIESFLSWFPVINVWVPLDFGFRFLIIYYEVVMMLVTWKWLKKHIPFIG